MQKRIRIFSFFVMLALIVSTISAETTHAAKKKKVTVKKVTVSAPSGKTVYVAKGKKVKLTSKVTVTPNKKANKKVTYRSKNKKIATVTSKGTVKGKKAGKTKIVVTSKKNKKKKATIKVVVKKAAVKKVSMAKTLSLTVGASKKLSATVTPKKNTSKKLAWTSSNPKVATVKNGTVKAKVAGKTTIKAKSTDGSNKSATCTVTVSSGKTVTKTNLASVNVYGSTTLSLSLSRAQSLAIGNITIQYKASPNAKYRTATIDRLTTQDNRNYMLSLASVDQLRTGYYLKATISSLSGTKTKEITVGAFNQTTPPKYAFSGMVGKEFSEYIYLQNYLAGIITSYKITSVPAGLKTRVYTDKIQIYGTPTAVADGTTTKITLTQDNGKTMVISMNFYIGDENTLVVGQMETQSFGKDAYFQVSATSGVAGGYSPSEYKTREDYTYERLTSYPNGEVGSTRHDGELSFSFFEDGYIVGCFEKEGTYTFPIKITAPNGLSKVIQIVIKITPSVNIKGTVRDAEGNVMPYKNVYIYFEDNAVVEDYESDWDSVGGSCGKDGTFSHYIQKGRVGTLKVMDYPIGRYTFTKDMNLNIKLPVYRVEFDVDEPWQYLPDPNYQYNYYTVEKAYVAPVNTLLSSGCYISNGSPDYAFFPSGAYKITGSITIHYSDGSNNYELQKEIGGNFTVSGKSLKNVPITIK